jgi:UDP-glucuronate decarboxylase
VAGGAGFLGSHLSESLLDNGHEVVVIDNLYTGSLDNIKHLRQYKKFEFINHDVTMPLDIDVDGIFNLACPASPIHYQRDPIGTFYTCIFGSHNLLQLADAKKIKILQASTSEIYGDPQVSPQKESYWGNVNSVGIRSCYDEGKRAAETLFSDFHNVRGTKIQIARIFNTYGPRMALNDGRVVSNFIIQALSQSPLTIHGDGKQVRSLCYIDDLVNGLIKLFFLNEYVGPINLGNPQPVSITDLATEVIAMTKSKSSISYLPLPSDDPITREPDITLAKHKLKWSPVVDRHLGLQKTVDYFKNLV